MLDLLAGVCVLDVSILAPDMVGMHLADLGARVIKIELPPYGDHIRVAPGRLRPGAPSFSHLRWNRGKESLALDLKTSHGVEIFLALAAQADVVIEGLRAGTMERLGVGYDAVRKKNPAIVFCAISGTGQTGPYVRLGLHGAGIDGFSGVAPVATRDDGEPYIGAFTAYGSRVGPLYGALATVAALLRARGSGAGAFIDVAETDAAAHANADSLFTFLNTGQTVPREAFKHGVRYQAYRASDGKAVMFQAFEYKFWKNFCEAVGRPDLLLRGGDGADPKPNDLNLAAGDEELRVEIAAIMRTRTQREWIDFFIEHQYPGSPMHSLEEMVEDPHFVARENVCEVVDAELGSLRMPTTPIKVVGSRYETRPGPTPGQHTDEILRSLLGYDTERIARLRAERVIS